MREMHWAIGLMTGTSIDGIDAALIKTNGIDVTERGESLTIPYDVSWAARMREAVFGEGDMQRLEIDLTLKHVEAIDALIEKSSVSREEIEVIGFHGQTVSHRPDMGMTWQIGNGALLAEKTGINVVSDFRRRDVAAGGQGAPLVPLYHAALAKGLELPVAVVNIGGIANVTWVGAAMDDEGHIANEDILAFDTGPGNVLINEWIYRSTGESYDRGGAIAKTGEVDDLLIRRLVNMDFFNKMPPKSLDRNDFNLDAVKHMNIQNGAATLAAFTAAAIEDAERFFPRPVTKWYIAGGGRHNTAVMESLQERLEHVEPVDVLGWEGDALEAQAFAYLAMRSINGLELTLPNTTGVNRAVTGGAFYQV